VLSLRRRLLAVVVLAPLTLVNVNCDGGSASTGSAARPVYCTVMADPVKRESVSPNGTGDHIVAPAHFRCDRPGPDTLTLNIALQQRVNGQWVTVVSRQFTAGGADTTRSHSEASRVRQVVAPCTEGVFRTLLDGTGVTKGTTTKYAMHGLAVTNPCRRLP
jgi:hypothetical protein